VSRVLDHDRLFRSEPGMLEQISERLVSLKRDYDMEVYLVYLVYLVVRSCGRAVVRSCGRAVVLDRRESSGNWG
jgi:hypothetical protein